MPVPRKYTEKEKDGRRVSSAVVREAVKHLEGFHTLTSTRRLKASLPCIAGRLLGDGKGEEFLSLILFISHFLQIFFFLRPFFFLSLVAQISSAKEAPFESSSRRAILRSGGGGGIFAA